MREDLSIDRRQYMKLGLAATVGLSSSAAVATPVTASHSSPVGKDGDWSLTFEDRFDQGSLDTSKWSIGYGWGRTSDGRREYVRDRDVWIDDSADQLVLNIDHDGNDGWYSGAVNTKDKHAQQHGYWEARLKPPEAVSGLLPSFWAKPNNEDWPPEIDVVEWMGSRTTSVHHVHYRDDSGKDDWGYYHDTGEDLSANFHVYGCEWTPEEVIWYLDGEEVARTSAGSGSHSRHLNYGQPFYTMLSCHIWDQDWLGGSPEDLSNYPYQYRADWVRIWEYDPDRESSEGHETPAADDFDVLDSFEDSLEGYGGDVDAFEINDGYATRGESSLYSGASDYETLLLDGSAGFEPGDTLRLDVLPSGGQRFELNFSRGGASDRYVASLGTGANSELYLTKVDDGAWENLAYASESIPEDETLVLEVDWGTDGEMTLTVYDADLNAVRSLTATDESPPAGDELALVMGGDSDGERWFDALRIRKDGDEAPEDEAPDEEDDSTDEDTGSTAVMTVEGGDADTPVNYLVRLDHPDGDVEIEKSDAYGATIQDDDAILGSYVFGVLRGERDSYRINRGSDVVEFRSEEDLEVLIDGQPVDCPCGPL